MTHPKEILDPVTLDICWQRLIGVVIPDTGLLSEMEGREALGTHTAWLQAPGVRQTRHQAAVVAARDT